MKSVLTCETSHTAAPFLHERQSLWHLKLQAQHGARHPTSICFSLGMDESKHNPKPATTVKYSGPLVDTLCCHLRLDSYALKASLLKTVLSFCYENLEPNPDSPWSLCPPLAATGQGVSSGDCSPGSRMLSGTGFRQRLSNLAILRITRNFQKSKNRRLHCTPSQSGPLGVGVSCHYL